MILHWKERLGDRCHLDRLKVRDAKGHRSESSICGIPAGGDAHEGFSRGEPGGVVDEPAAILECFEYGVKVHGREPGRIDRRESGGHSCGSAQGNAEVGEVVAGPHAGKQGVFG